MESCAFVSRTSIPPMQNQLKPQKLIDVSVFPIRTTLQNRFLLPLTPSCSSHSHQNHIAYVPKTTSTLVHPLRNQISIHKTTFLPQISHILNPLQNHTLTKRDSFYLGNALQLSIGLMMVSLSFPFSAIPAETDQLSVKINIESILISIDDFFNRNPFFVAGVTFIWLVVIPVTEYYLKKCKFVSAIDSFRKLRDDPNSQLLDIRKKQSVEYMGSPNLKLLKKMVAQVEYRDGEDDGFLNEVKEKFRDPANTVVCVLDNFDGNSMKVAQLLFDKGFKEVYAIKGGLRGKDGWQEIQETLLPPSMHVYPRKGKVETSNRLESPEGINKQNSENCRIPDTSVINLNGNGKPENGYVKSTETAPQAKLGLARPSSPYPNYPDLKPPSSPTPSKPRN